METIFYMLLCLLCAVSIYLAYCTITYIVLFNLTPKEAFLHAINELKFWKK